jgi:hypothetical protein
MSLGNTFENDVLKLFFNATAIADLAENDATSPLGNLFVALHKTNPGEAGDQTTGEADYTGYARQTVARTSGGWTVTNNRVVNAADIQYPTCTAGTNTLLFWSVGKVVSGASQILAYGPLGPATGFHTFNAENSTDVITSKGHGLVVDDRVVFLPLPNTTFPTGITEGTVYFVKTVPDADTYTLAATSGGSTIDVTADGDGVVHKVIPVVVSTGNPVAKIAAGALTIDLD